MKQINKALLMCLGVTAFAQQVRLFDPATKQLVWRGSASKTLEIKKDPDKNYRNLEKAMAKLFQNYPPGIGKH